MGFTISKANSILNAEFQKTYYIGLSKTAPNDSGGNISEPSSTTGYTRCQLTNIGASNNKQIESTHIWYFGEIIADIGEVPYFFVASSLTGTPHYWGELEKVYNEETGEYENYSLYKGQVGLIRVGDFKVGLDKETLD